MNNGVKKVLINIILTICVTSFITLIGYVVANDMNSRDRDTTINAEYIEADRRITEEYKESDRQMTQRNTEAFNGQIEATNNLKVTVGKLDTSIQFLGEQLERIADGN